MKISEAELTIMKVLWETPGLGAAEVHTAVEEETEWSDRTVKTMLSRLAEKKALRTKEDGRRYLYFPLISEEDYASRATAQFVDRMFSGRAAPLVAHLADARGLTDADLDELEALLKQLKGDA